MTQDELARLKKLLSEHPELLDQVIARIPSRTHRVIYRLIQLGVPLLKLLTGGKARGDTITESLRDLHKSLMELLEEDSK